MTRSNVPHPVAEKRLGVLFFLMEQTQQPLVAAAGVAVLDDWYVMEYLPLLLGYSSWQQWEPPGDEYKSDQ